MFRVGELESVKFFGDKLLADACRNEEEVPTEARNFDVWYLDCVNLGCYKVTDEIPRNICWKDNMIIHFCELDQISNSKFGRRPLILQTTLITCFC
ncbi:hypothetical protein ACP4OV_013068 [Aristida adscensionis]